MSDAQKKQNFLQGTALLAMATAIVKIIGAFYKIPSTPSSAKRASAISTPLTRSTMCF